MDGVLEPDGSRLDDAAVVTSDDAADERDDTTAAAYVTPAVGRARVPLTRVEAPVSATSPALEHPAKDQVSTLYTATPTPADEVPASGSAWPYPDVEAPAPGDTTPAAADEVPASRSAWPYPDSGGQAAAWSPRYGVPSGQDGPHVDRERPAVGPDEAPAEAEAPIAYDAVSLPRHAAPAAQGNIPPAGDDVSVAHDYPPVAEPAAPVAPAVGRARVLGRHEMLPEAPDPHGPAHQHIPVPRAAAPADQESWFAPHRRDALDALAAEPPAGPPAALPRRSVADPADFAAMPWLKLAEKGHTPWSAFGTPAETPPAPAAEPAPARDMPPPEPAYPDPGRAGPVGAARPDRPERPADLPAHPPVVRAVARVPVPQPRTEPPPAEPPPAEPEPPAARAYPGTVAEPRPPAAATEGWGSEPPWRSGADREAPSFDSASWQPATGLETDQASDWRAALSRPATTDQPGWASASAHRDATSTTAAPVAGTTAAPDAGPASAPGAHERLDWRATATGAAPVDHLDDHAPAKDLPAPGDERPGQGMPAWGRERAWRPAPVDGGEPADSARPFATRRAIGDEDLDRPIAVPRAVPPVVGRMDRFALPGLGSRADAEARLAALDQAEMDPDDEDAGLRPDGPGRVAPAVPAEDPAARRDGTTDPDEDEDVAGPAIAGRPAGLLGLTDTGTRPRSGLTDTMGRRGLLGLTDDLPDPDIGRDLDISKITGSIPQAGAHDATPGHAARPGQALAPEHRPAGSYATDRHLADRDTAEDSAPQAHPGAARAAGAFPFDGGARARAAETHLMRPLAGADKDGLATVALPTGHHGDLLPEDEAPVRYDTDDWRGHIRGTAAKRSSTLYRDERPEAWTPTADRPDAVPEDEDGGTLSLADRIGRIVLLVGGIILFIVLFLYGPQISQWWNG